MQVEEFVVRAQVEEAFKWWMDRRVVPVMPFWVRLDVTVAGHMFLTVTRLPLLRYLQWELPELDLSIKELVKETNEFSNLNLGSFIPTLR